MPTLRVRIPGSRSIHASRAITTALALVPGVTAIDIRLGEATIEHDGRASCDLVRTAIAQAGFDVSDCTDERRSLPIV